MILRDKSGCIVILINSVDVWQLHCFLNKLPGKEKVAVVAS